MTAFLLPSVVVSCYIFDIWILPMKSVETFVSLAFSGTKLKNHCLLLFSSCIIDIIFFGFGCFLAITYASNFSGIIHFFMTVSIGNLT